MLLFFVERLKALVCVVELLHLSSVARAHSHMYLTGDILTLLHSPHISPIWVWQCEYSGSKSRLVKFQHALYRPLARHGNAANLEDKTKKISLPGIEIYSHVKQNLVLFSKLAAFPRTCMGSIFHIVPSTFQWNLDGFYADCNPTSSSYPSLYIFPLPLTGRSVAINTCTYDTRLQSIHATTTKEKKKERERERKHSGRTQRGRLSHSVSLYSETPLI